MATVTVDQLDDEILSKILDHCPKTQHSYIRLENVCAKWRQVVNKHQGVFLVAAGMNADPNALLVKDVKGYSRIQVGDHSTKIPNMFENPTSETSIPTPQESGDSNVSNAITSLQELQERLPCPPDFVRKMAFMGKMAIQIPCGFLMMCKNLSGLHFHLSSLTGIPLTPPPPAMDIPTLKTFVIDSYGLEQNLKDGVAERGPKMIQVLDVALSLLGQNTFPYLETLIVDIPLCGEKEKATVGTISKFLGRHEKVSSFCFHQGFLVARSESAEASAEEDEDMDDNSEENEVSLASLASSSVDLKKISLKELHIGLYMPQESDPLWINFMIQQTKLEKLIFTGDRIPFPGITVRVNQSTLTTLIMEMRDNVDCENLKDCSHLRKLSLLGKNEDCTEEDDDTYLMEVDEENNNNGAEIVSKHVNVYNLKYLPESLESLRINRLKIDRRGISEVIFGGGVGGQKWGRLLNLELIDCGVEGNLGVPLQAVAHIMEKKNFKWFQIDYSLNRKSVLERKLPPQLQMLAYVLKNNSVSNFVLQGHLNPMGFYEPCKPLLNLKTTEIFGGVEMDLFQFPEEIYPTGSHRRVDPDVRRVGHGHEHSSSDATGTEDDDSSGSGDDGDDDSSLEDMSASSSDAGTPGED